MDLWCSSSQHKRQQLKKASPEQPPNTVGFHSRGGGGGDDIGDDDNDSETESTAVHSVPSLNLDVESNEEVVDVSVDVEHAQHTGANDVERNVDMEHVQDVGAKDLYSLTQEMKTLVLFIDLY